MNVRLVGMDQSRADRHDPHLGRPLLRQPPPEHGNTGLGRGIRRGAGRRPERADAANENHRAPIGLILHDLVGHLGHVQRRQQIEANDALVKPWRRSCRWRRRRPAGVVHHHVQPTMLGDDHGEHGLERLQVLDIAGDEPRLAVAGADRRFRLRASANDDSGTGGEESFGDASTNPLRAPRHQRDPSRIVEMNRHEALAPALPVLESRQLPAAILRLNGRGLHHMGGAAARCASSSILRQSRPVSGW